jgi:hypothetical protein
MCILARFPTGSYTYVLFCRKGRYGRYGLRGRSRRDHAVLFRVEYHSRPDFYLVLADALDIRRLLR